MNNTFIAAKKIVYITGLLVTFLFQACQKEAQIPTQFVHTNEPVNIFPDYTDITIPSNIAPLNFMIKDSVANEFIVSFQGLDKSTYIVGGEEDGKIMIDSLTWKEMLQKNAGKSVQVSVFAHKKEQWVKYPDYEIRIAEEPIDAYLSYRLIEPGYELYRQLGIYQRNLTNWQVKTIYENNRTYDNKENHCINCHNYKNYSAEDMLFHVRANHGGTVVIQNGQAKKVQIKDSTILTAGVYPSWHPTKNLVAFSTNRTGQTFHLYHPEKIEVIDEASDLLLYNPEKNEVSHILQTKDKMETFPCWSPDGKTLYYCKAETTDFVNLEETPDSVLAREISLRYSLVKYSLMKISYDTETDTFGQPEMVVDAPAMKKSISVPRVSPDGRYILYTLGDYGQFHIWHKSSDLWVKDLETDSCYALTKANSNDVDSYHTWSSNGRWMVFSSRRDDGNYTRPYITYFNKDGIAEKAFMIPHQDPEESILLLRSYNVPELTKDEVSISSEEIQQCIYQTEGEKAIYKQR